MQPRCRAQACTTWQRHWRRSQSSARVPVLTDADCTISDETFEQLVAFLETSRAATGTDLPVEQAADYLIQIGINDMVGNLLRSLDPAALVQDVLRLAREHPTEVYDYIAETMRRGAEEIARLEQEASRPLGFVTPR